MSETKHRPGFFKLGKKPAREGAVKLKMATYLKKSDLPPVPDNFGHEAVIKPGTWGMLGNDQYGDCVWAGAAHETMMWNAAAGRNVHFTDAGVLSDYSAVTGFNKKDPNTDQGTDMVEAASYRQKTGVKDSHGKRHKVTAYLAIEPGNYTQLLEAAYLFGAVGIGIRFPDSAMDQFNAGKPWDVVKGASIEGGHYIPFVARRGSFDEIVTWGKVQAMTPAFYKKYCDEAVAYITDEFLDANGKSPEGFDLAALEADFHSLTGRKMIA